MENKKKYFYVFGIVVNSGLTPYTNKTGVIQTPYYMEADSAQEVDTKLKLMMCDTESSEAEYMKNVFLRTNGKMRLLKSNDPMTFDMENIAYYTHVLDGLFDEMCTRCSKMHDGECVGSKTTDNTVCVNLGDTGFIKVKDMDEAIRLTESIFGVNDVRDNMTFIEEYSSTYFDLGIGMATFQS